MERCYRFIEKHCNMIFGILLGILIAFTIANIAAFDIIGIVIFGTLSFLTLLVYNIIIDIRIGNNYYEKDIKIK